MVSNGSGGITTRVYWLRAALLLCATAAVLLAGNGRASVFDRDEARFALAVREMRERGDWVLPTNFGEPRYHKPILAYACALASERLLGVGELAWRLPSVLAGLGSVAITLALARRRYGERVALRAGAIVATSLVFVIEDKILTADALQLCATALAFWAWLERRERGAPGAGWRLVFWLAVALGILAKGVNLAFLAAAGAAMVFLCPVREGRAPRGVLAALAAGSIAAAIPPLAVLGPVSSAAAALWLWSRARGTWRDAWRASGARWGIPLVVALVGLWLVPALVRSRGGFLSEGVGHHMLARTANAFEGHAGFPGYYLLSSALFLFPWAAWVPAALRRAWRDPRFEFLLAWVLGPWALLEGMASKLPHYVLVVLPALAILVALEWERRETALRGVLERVLYLFTPLALAAASLWLAGTSTGALRGAMLGLCALALVLAALASVLARRAAFAPVLAGALALYLWLGALVLPALEPQRLAPRLGAELARLALPGESIHMVRWCPASVGCYAPAGHALVQDSGEIEAALSTAHPGIYVVEGTRLERFQRDHPGPWQRLGALQGLRGLGPDEIVLLRRAGG